MVGRGQGGGRQPGGQHGAAHRPVWPQLGQVGGVGQVVKDDKPGPGGLTEPAQEPPGQLLLVRPRAVPAGVVTEGPRVCLRVPGQDRGAARRGDPDQQLHVAGLPQRASVGGRELRLADAARPGQQVATAFLRPDRLVGRAEAGLRPRDGIGRRRREAARLDRPAHHRAGGMLLTGHLRSLPLFWRSQLTATCGRHSDEHDGCRRPFVTCGAGRPQPAGTGSRSVSLRWQPGRISPAGAGRWLPSVQAQTAASW